MEPELRNFLLEAMPKASVCAEIGVWKGDFSELILKNISPSKLYLIDPYLYVKDYVLALYGGYSGSQKELDKVYDSVCVKFKQFVEKKVVEIVREQSNNAYTRFPDNYFDWIYIDGNHTYEYVKQDINNFFSKIKINGYITGDDYKLKGWWDEGVEKAVDEFIENNKERVEVIILDKEHQFILKKIR